MKAFMNSFISSWSLVRAFEAPAASWLGSLEGAGDPVWLVHHWPGYLFGNCKGYEGRFLETSFRSNSFRSVRAS